MPNSNKVDSRTQLVLYKNLLARFGKYEKFLTTIFVLLAVVGGVYANHLTGMLSWCFQHMPESGQVAVVAAMFVVLVIIAVRLYLRESLISELEAETKTLTDQLETAHKTQNRLNDMAVKDIWHRPDLGHHPFSDLRSRRARFISFLNFKGGPGKTTLSANLAGCFASMKSPLKVLVIDLDFQGTLSNRCVEHGTRKHQRVCSLTAARLLDNNIDVRNLIVDMDGVQNAQVIVADDTLQSADYTVQSRFFLDVDSNRDVRFLYRALFHSAAIANEFDVVIFDCPPRLTTSTVNALACSDYIIIPVELDKMSYETVPRTIDIVSQLANITNHSKILGVVANKVVYWREELTKSHKSGLKRLRDVLHKRNKDLHVFSAKIPWLTAISASDAQGDGPSSDPNVRSIFVDLAVEIRKRIDK